MLDDKYVVYNCVFGKVECFDISVIKGGSSGTSIYDYCFVELWLVDVGGGILVRFDLVNGSLEFLYYNFWSLMSDKVVGKCYWIVFLLCWFYGVFGGLQFEVTGGFILINLNDLFEKLSSKFIKMFIVF